MQWLLALVSERVAVGIILDSLGIVLALIALAGYLLNRRDLLGWLLPFAFAFFGTAQILTDESLWIGLALFGAFLLSALWNLARMRRAT